MSTKIRVEFRSQGGKWRTGFAVGRMGSRLLINYHIDSGEQRERWFGKDRYKLLMDQKPIDTLPRYAKRVCPAVKFPIPEIHPDWTEAHNQGQCPKCGDRHNIEASRERDGGGVTVFGRRSKNVVILVEGM